MLHHFFTAVSAPLFLTFLRRRKMRNKAEWKTFSYTFSLSLSLSAYFCIFSLLHSVCDAVYFLDSFFSVFSSLNCLFLLFYIFRMYLRYYEHEHHYIIRKYLRVDIQKTIEGYLSGKREIETKFNSLEEKKELVYSSLQSMLESLNKYWLLTNRSQKKSF